MSGKNCQECGAYVEIDEQDTADVMAAARKESEDRIRTLEADLDAVCNHLKESQAEVVRLRLHLSAANNETASAQARVRELEQIVAGYEDLKRDSEVSW